MFIFDKYTPKKISDVFFHKDLMKLLLKISKDDAQPHIIFYGPAGSGKKALIRLFLEQMYDSNVHDVVDSIYTVVGSGSTVTNVPIKQSNYHIEINPNNNNFDRYLIQDVVKEYAKRLPLDVFSTNRIFKTVLINNTDNLPYYAQTSLRRTMEKYSGSCRFIMWCRSLSKVIEPLHSRCLCLRVSSPSNEELFERLYKISLNEGMSLKLTDFDRIIASADGNIKKALCLLELKKYNIHSETSYEKAIDSIINLLIFCNIDYTDKIREFLYIIMITNIEGTQIIKDILLKILEHEAISDKSKMIITNNASNFEHNLIRGRREIIHLEAFINSIIGTLLENDIKSLKKFVMERNAKMSTALM
jgi:replication factor C subunit 3/5